MEIALTLARSTYRYIGLLGRIRSMFLMKRPTLLSTILIILLYSCHNVTVQPAEEHLPSIFVLIRIQQ